MEQINAHQYPEFDKHSLVMRVTGNPHVELHGFIAFHRGGKYHPAFGATRMWTYETEEQALRDALRLSKIMSYKSALAGLPYGGAKGVIMANSVKSDEKIRESQLRAYAQCVNDFKGAFITGSDVGVLQKDVLIMHDESPYFVGLRTDASKYTCLGLYIATSYCLSRTYGSADIHGRTFAIQGMGKIGGGLLRLLYPSAEHIFITDTDPEAIRIAKQDCPRVSVVEPDEIHKQTVDVFCPCALSGALNKTTISQLQAPIVVGGANNQLESDEIGEDMYHNGVLYAPDYIVNAGGLISVADEYEHTMANSARIEKKVAKIKDRLELVFDMSKEKARSPHAVANRLAEKVFNSI